MLTEFGDKSKSAILALRWPPKREVRRAQTIAQTLDAVLPAAVLRQRGSLLAVNESFQRLVPLVAQDQQERPTLMDAAADALLVQTLAALSTRRCRLRRFCKRFDLTPAEARIARGIGEAQSVEALATALSVSRETVCVQLKSVPNKTALNRQAELANLLAGLALPR